MQCGEFYKCGKCEWCQEDEYFRSIDLQTTQEEKAAMATFRASCEEF